jgi:hypothetical protein
LIMAPCPETSPRTQASTIAVFSTGGNEEQMKELVSKDTGEYDSSLQHWRE